MKYSAVVLALATSVLAQYEYTNSTSSSTVVYETITTTALTTYCPYATTVVQGQKTYTVSEATTLTITDCPCTLTKAMTYAVSAPPPAPTGAIPGTYPAGQKPSGSTVLYTSCPPGASSSAAAPPPAVPASSAPYYSNPLTVVYSAGATKPAAVATYPAGAASGTNTPAQPTTPVYTGAASINQISIMVGAAAIVALVL